MEIAESTPASLEPIETTLFEALVPKGALYWCIPPHHVS